MKQNEMKWNGDKKFKSNPNPNPSQTKPKQKWNEVKKEAESSWVPMDGHLLNITWQIQNDVY